MPLPWTIAIVTVAVVALVARVCLTALPIGAARPLPWGDLAVVLVGVVGLVAHCGAMFLRATVLALPGTGGYVDTVNALGGLPSKILYAVPALLVLVGLRRLPVAAPALLAVAFVAVGLTMYDGGPLSVHLTTILVSVVVLSASVAALVGRPAGPGRPAPLARPAAGS